MARHVPNGWRSGRFADSHGPGQEWDGGPGGAHQANVTSGKIKRYKPGKTNKTWLKSWGSSLVIQWTMIFVNPYHWDNKDLHYYYYYYNCLIIIQLFGYNYSNSLNSIQKLENEQIWITNTTRWNTGYPT